MGIPWGPLVLPRLVITEQTIVTTTAHKKGKAIKNADPAGLKVSVSLQGEQQLRVDLQQRWMRVREIEKA